MKHFLPFLFLTLLSLSAIAQYPDVSNSSSSEDENDGYYNEYITDDPAWFWNFSGGYVNAFRPVEGYAPVDALLGYNTTGGIIGFGLDLQWDETVPIVLQFNVNPIISNGNTDRLSYLETAIEDVYPDMMVQSSSILRTYHDEKATNESSPGLFNLGVGYELRHDLLTVTGSVYFTMLSVNPVASSSRLKEYNTNNYYNLYYTFEDDFMSAYGPSAGINIQYRLSKYFKAQVKVNYSWLRYNFNYQEELYDIYNNSSTFTDHAYSGITNLYNIQGGIAFMF